jgi:hypothetical protein
MTNRHARKSMDGGGRGVPLPSSVLIIDLDSDSDSKEFIYWFEIKSPRRVSMMKLRTDSGIVITASFVIR